MKGVKKRVRAGMREEVGRIGRVEVGIGGI
jgi:hypothetical protein